MTLKPPDLRERTKQYALRIIRLYIELLVAAGIVPTAQVTDLLQETNELIAIFVASVKTAKGKK
jgi:hypothetical protein